MIDRKTMFNLVYTLQASAIADAYEDAMQNRGWYSMDSYVGGEWVYVFVPKEFGEYEVIEACYMLGHQEWWIRNQRSNIKPTHWRPLFAPPES
jgi:hypothetical protein